MNNRTETEKLQKAIAETGFASRREAERLIEAGRVRVNGHVAHLGQRVRPEDEISIDGRRLKRPKPDVGFTEVLIYHKPEGRVCTRKDEQGRPTIFEQLPRRHHGRWVSVGRLDLNTSGLLLVTNNGELANRLMHPRHEVEREYAVRILGELTEEDISQLKRGLQLEDGPARFERVRPVPGEQEGRNHWYHVVIKEGRYREVRRLFEKLGYTVSRLIRVRYGDIRLPRDLPRGKTRALTWKQVNAPLRSVGLPEEPRPDHRHSAASASRTKQVRRRRR